MLYDVMQIIFLFLCHQRDLFAALFLQCCDLIIEFVLPVLHADPDLGDRFQESGTLIIQSLDLVIGLVVEFFQLRIDRIPCILEFTLLALIIRIGQYPCSGVHYLHPLCLRSQYHTRRPVEECFFLHTPTIRHHYRRLFLQPYDIIEPYRLNKVKMRQFSKL